MELLTPFHQGAMRVQLYNLGENFLLCFQQYLNYLIYFNSFLSHFCPEYQVHNSR